MIELINRQEAIETVKESIITRTCYTPYDHEVDRIINELSSVPIRGIKTIELINRQEVIDAVKKSIIAHLCYRLDDYEVAGIIKDLQSILVMGTFK